MEAYERLLRLGEDVEPIKRSLSVPRNDFVWLTRDNRVTEMKSTKARYETIRNSIHQAVRKAQEKGVVKDIFLIDIGEAELTEKLARELGCYNLDRSRYMIRELYVMSGDGARIDRIALR